MMCDERAALAATAVRSLVSVADDVCNELTVWLLPAGRKSLLESPDWVKRDAEQLYRLVHRLYRYFVLDEEDGGADDGAGHYDGQ